MKLAEVAIKASKGDSECTLIIIDKFMVSILKFSRELKYEEAQTDLIIGLLESMQKFKAIFTLEWHDAMVVKYLHQLLLNKKIDLFRKHVKGKENIYINIEDCRIAAKDNFEEYFIMNESIKLLTSKQQLVIRFKCFYGYNDAEISGFMNVSRQSINKTNRNAIFKLKEIYAQTQGVN